MSTDKHVDNYPYPAVVTRAARNQVRDVQRKPWFGLLASAGLISRAAIYALLGHFAVDIAIRGNSPAQTNGTGAITEVARQPGALVLLVILALGLLAYGSWRLVSAIGGPTADRGADSVTKRVGWAIIAAVYFILFSQTDRACHRIGNVEWWPYVTTQPVRRACASVAGRS